MYSKFLKYYCLMLISLLFSIQGYCQVNDAGLWMNVGLEKQLNKKISLLLSQELRMNENISEAGTVFTELGGQYKIIKNLSFSASYRFIMKRNLDDSYSKRHRYMLDLAYKYKFHKFNFSVRERFQNQYSDIYSSSAGAVPATYLRNKLSLKYGIRKRIDAYLSGEFFYQLNNPDGNELDNERFTAGMSYKLNRASDFDVFYMINKELNVKDPWTSYIIGIGYNYSF